MIWVIDTSALIRLFIPDGPLAADTEVALGNAAATTDAVLAPELLLVEAGNVLLRKCRRGEITGAESDEIFEAILTLPIRLRGHRPLMARANGLARAHRLSVYDATYLALAERHGARLITCDDVLAAAAREIGAA